MFYIFFIFIYVSNVQRSDLINVNIKEHLLFLNPSGAINWYIVELEKNIFSFLIYLLNTF